MLGKLKLWRVPLKIGREGGLGVHCRKNPQEKSERGCVLGFGSWVFMVEMKVGSGSKVQTTLRRRNLTRYCCLDSPFFFFFFFFSILLVVFFNQP
jgi:hypothetical protein